jgi:hypothetical protein
MGGFGVPEPPTTPKAAADLKLIFHGQLTGDLALEALVAEYNMEILAEGFAWPGTMSGPNWDNPMLVMYDMSPIVPVPVGFVAFSSSKWIKEISVQGFYIKPAYRGLNFIKLLAGLKDHILENYPTTRYISWCTHWDNDRVRKIAKRIGMEPRSVSYSMDISTGHPDDPRVTSKGESITK